MLEAFKKSKQISIIALDRLSDYLALFRIEMKMQGREMGMQLMGYLMAAFSMLFAMLFIGIAIIVSFWDSAYRGIAAWAAVAIYIGAAGFGVALARRHAGKSASLHSLREEFKRDVDLVRENL